jgi:hypothetical protein
LCRTKNEHLKIIKKDEYPYRVTNKEELALILYILNNFLLSLIFWRQALRGLYFYMGTLNFAISLIPD